MNSLNDLEGALNAVKQDGLLLERVPYKFKLDLDIAFLAIRQNKMAFDYVPYDLWSNPIF